MLWRLSSKWDRHWFPPGPQQVLRHPAGSQITSHFRISSKTTNQALSCLYMNLWCQRLSVQMTILKTNLQRMVELLIFRPEIWESQDNREGWGLKVLLQNTILIQKRIQTGLLNRQKRKKLWTHHKRVKVDLEVHFKDNREGAHT